MSSRRTGAPDSFPPWAPDSIVNLCKSARARLASAYESNAPPDIMVELEVEVDVCERLAHKSGMRAVWKALHRCARWQQGKKGHDGKLVREIVREKLQAPHRSRRTNAERRDLFLKTGKKARELKQLVIRVAAEERLGHWATFDEGGQQSDFFDELDRLIREAINRARQPERHTKRTPNLAAIDMAKRLSRFVESELGQLLHERVVTITNVVCDSTLNRDNLKSALRSGGASRALKLKK